MTAVTPIFILGMHRSGTSCLAGCLEEAGLYLGEVNRAAPFNKKGNNENKAVMDLNDDVLAANGGAWDDPAVRTVSWSPEQTQRLHDLIRSYPDDRVWGVKDPRMLLTMQGWLQTLSPRFVGTFRHPEEVKRSLQRRAQAWGGDMPDEQAYSLWRRYNENLLALHAQNAFPLIRYGSQMERYKSDLLQVLDRLELRSEGYEFNFLESSLKSEAFDGDVPASCRDVWEGLNEIAL